jgi:hypothetical protein
MIAKSLAGNVDSQSLAPHMGTKPNADDSTLGNNSINVREQPPLLALPLPLRRRRLGVGKSGMSYSFAFKREDGLIGFGGLVEEVTARQIKMFPAENHQT